MNAVAALIAIAGPVGYLLAANALLLAVLVSERVLALYGPGTGSRARQRDLAALWRRSNQHGGACDHGRQVALAERPELTRHLRWIRVLVWVAPLLGLLGTVDGMIAVFDHIGGDPRHAGIATGIGAALVTTQLGLLIAIPGMIAERLLTRRSELLASQQAWLAVRLAGPEAVV